jgi:hypothetical protein
MTVGADEPFRFLDLPAELRNNIYGLLLCSFGEPSSALDNNFFPCLRTISTSSVDPTILRTSSQIYREAYDTMLKTNQFIKVNCTSGLGLTTILRNKRIPTVHMATGGRGFEFEC